MKEGPRRIEGNLGPEKLLETLVCVISSGKEVLDAVMLEMGRMRRDRSSWATRRPWSSVCG
jgi:hypothetical protein